MDMRHHIGLDREGDRIILIQGAGFMTQKYRELRDAGLSAEEAKKQANEWLSSLGDI